MECDLINFNVKQVAKCKLCKHASANVNHLTKIGFCSARGVHIDDPAKRNQSPIILLDRKIIKDANIQMQPLFQQGKNLAMASAAHVASGMKNRSDEDAAKCFEICQGNEGVAKCEFFDTGRQRCSKCGCYMKVKTRWQSAHCPLGKW